MKRREFVRILGGAAVALPFCARAQQPAGRVYGVGYLTVASREQRSI
jgi:putative ABC transport system substrate-binding protein